MSLAAVGIILILLAFVPISIRVSESEISPNATIFNHRWIGAIILGFWNGLSFLKQPADNDSPPIKFFPDNYKLVLLLLIVGLFAAIQQLLYAWSLSKTSVANSEVLHSLTPIFTALVGWRFLGQKFDRRFLLGIAIAICGSIALVANDFSITIDKLQGDGLALVSAIIWGGCLPIVEKLQTQLSARLILTWNSLVGLVFLLPILLVVGDELFPHSWWIWLMVFTVGIVRFVNSFLLIYSLKQLSSGLVTTILLLHPVITAILAWVIFSEALSSLNLLVFVIMLFGVYLAASSQGGIKITEE